MKKIIIKSCLIAGICTSLSGCSDYLDSDYLFDERMSIENVFTNREYTDEWLARTYAYLGNNYLQDVCSKKSMPYNFADDMYFGDGGYKEWKSGVYNENGKFGESAGIWNNAYLGIKQASIFVNNIDMNYAITEELRQDFKGQAIFLRAYFYWILLRTFGPVPILPNEGIDYMESYDDIAHPRNTYEECVNFIADECARAAGMLPLQRGMSDLARATRGSALALRAKVLLFGASPLYNGKAPMEVANALVDKHGKHLLPDTYDESKWARAAAAAKDVMDLQMYSLYVAKARTTGDIAYPVTVKPFDDGNFSEKPWPNGYQDIDPFESYRSVFNGTVQAYENPELIFTRGKNQGNEGINLMVLHQLPRVYAYGYGSHGMTQKQCDAYYMYNGEDCPGMNSMYAGKPGYTDPMRYNMQERTTGFVEADELNDYPELGVQGVGVSKQYAHREPRFYASVAYNGSTWNLGNADTKNDETPNVQVWYYRGDPNGYSATSYYPRSGMSIKKFVNPDDIGPHDYSAYNVGRFTKKVDPAIRYAEILLIYAEAVNELTSQTTYDIPSWDGTKVHPIVRDKNELKKGIQPIRIRAGIPDYTDEEYSDPDKFRIKLKRERQIELFAEGHRYFDLRRWMDAQYEEPLQVYGCNIYATKNQQELFHTPISIAEFPTIFTTKMWFCPINHTELKRNKELTQNPGWTNPE